MESCEKNGYLELEPENFRIDSAGWIAKRDSDGICYLEHPEGGVWELLDGYYFSGEQYFTQAAALREAAKAGKRIPTQEDWIRIIRNLDPSVDFEDEFMPNVSIRAALGLKLAGCRTECPVRFGNRGRFGHYWTSSVTGDRGSVFSFSHVQIRPSGILYRGAGLSVRCLKD